jgi:hypothetical protein
MIHLREENVVAIDLITQHIRMKLQQPDLRRIYHNLEVVPSNYQTRGMHTIIRDVKTNKTDFVFYADRLLRLVSHCAVIEQSLIASSHVTQHHVSTGLLAAAASAMSMLNCSVTCHADYRTQAVCLCTVQLQPSVDEC